MTITTVAERAGVSTATVSRVINGTAFVQPETAERVRAAILELNFHPDTNARALGSGRSGLYGLIISDITNPYFPELVKAFEDIAVEHGQDVLIANTDYDKKRMELCVTRMLQRKVDGVAIMTSEMDDGLMRSFSHRQIPVVFMDPPHAEHGIRSVCVNYGLGIRLGLEHLFELGHRSIGFLSGPLSLSSARERREAFVQGCRTQGISIEPYLLGEGDHRVEGGYAAMNRMLGAGDPPTALMASNDLTAIGAMGALHDAGLKIPGDVSVVGFDDILISAFTRPGLTTLHVPRRELAAVAFRSLYRTRGQLDTAASAKREHIITPELKLRSSTSPCNRIH